MGTSLGSWPSPVVQCTTVNVVQELSQCYELNSPENTMRKVDGQVVETPIEARAGFLDRPVLVVLVVSVLLAMGALLLVSVGVF